MLKDNRIIIIGVAEFNNLYEFTAYTVYILLLFCFHGAIVGLKRDEALASEQDSIRITFENTRDTTHIFYQTG